MDFSKFWDLLVLRSIIKPVNSESTRLKPVQNWNPVIVKDSDQSIGMGAFSTVYRGKWANLPDDLLESAPKQAVVIKVLRSYGSDPERKQSFFRVSPATKEKAAVYLVFNCSTG